VSAFGDAFAAIRSIILIEERVRVETAMHLLLRHDSPSILSTPVISQDG
jgi:hypothetical protein